MLSNGTRITEPHFRVLSGVTCLPFRLLKQSSGSEASSPLNAIVQQCGVAAIIESTRPLPSCTNERRDPG